jgi:hypothetical protein
LSLFLQQLPTAEKTRPRARKTLSLYDNPSIPEDQHRTSEERYWKLQVRWQRIGAIATILAFCAAAVYARYAKQQIQSIQQQLGDNEAAQRAHLVIVEPIVVKVLEKYGRSGRDPGLSVQFSILNAGSSVANEIGVRIDSTLTPHSRGIRFSSSGPSRTAPIMSQPDPSGGSITDGDTRAEDVPVIVGMEEINAIRNSKAWGYLQIIVSYVDIFGHQQAIADSVCYTSAAWSEVCGALPEPSKISLLAETPLCSK